MVKLESCNRIAIIGLPGSGKSTFAAELARLLKIPVHHLDSHVFDGKKKRDHQEFLAIKKVLVGKPSWIIDGCSFSTLDMRFARADTVIYFHFSRYICLWRLCKRIICFDKVLVNSGCLRGINWILLKYMWTFDRNKQGPIKELRKNYPHVEFIVFHHTRDVDNFLINLKNRIKAKLS